MSVGREGAAFAAAVRIELLRGARRAAPWAIFVVSCANAVLWWIGGPAVSRGWATNSDFNVARLCAGFAFITTPLFTAVMMGDPVASDSRLGVDAILLTKPFGKLTYLLAKFVGNYLLLAMCFAGFGVTLAVLQAFQPSGMIVQPLRIAPYVSHFVTLVLVPHLALAALCFTIGTLTRSVKLVYGLVVSLYVAYFAFQFGVLRFLPTRWTVALDPLAMNWVSEAVMRGRTAAQLNLLRIGYDADLLWNRAALVAFSAACLVFVWARFSRRVAATPRANVDVGLSLSRTGTDLYDDTRKASRTAAPSTPTVRKSAAGPLPSVTLRERGLRTASVQFAAALVTELRLLRAERSLWIVVPLVMVSCGFFLDSFSGFFGSPLYPVSSIYAERSANALLIILSGVTLFYTGEVVHRDRGLEVEVLVWSTPAPDWVLLLSKFAAIFLVALALALLAMATGIGNQIVKNAAPIDIAPYTIILAAIVVPNIVVTAGAALALNVLARDKYVAHVVGIAVAGIFVYLLGNGATHWLYNPVLYSLWVYSDLSGLEPYRLGLAFHRLYWLAITIAGLRLAHRFYPRLAHSRRSPWLTALAATVAVGAGLAIVGEVDRGPESPSLDAALIRYEDRFRAGYCGMPQPEVTRVDLRVALDPPRHTVTASGVFALTNRTDTPIASVLVTVNPGAQWSELTIDGAQAPQIDDLARLFAFDAPLRPGETTTLRASWTLAVPEGMLRDSSTLVSFVEEGGTMLGGPDRIGWLPAVGYQRGAEVADVETRRTYGRGPREPLPEMRGAGFVPSAWWNDNVPFDLHVEITVPADQTAITSGRLLEVRNEGGLRTFVYESESPALAFPILAGTYEIARRGDLAVFYHKGHEFNIDRMLDAMEAARAKYERDFGPLTWRDLRIVEFPRVATLAESHRTTIAFSEGAGFLSCDDAEHVDSVFFAVAHEVAHQWFGNLVVPGRSRGAAVLLEGLAEYSAGALIEEDLGVDAAVRFRRFEEATYLRERSADRESPLALLDESSPSDAIVAYQKAGLVFHMLENEIGRDRLNAALREYIARFGDRPNHPTIHDLIAIVRENGADESLDRFFDQWFERVVIPNGALVDANVRREGSDFVVEFTATNAGGGRVPVMVEAVGAGSRAAAMRIHLEEGQMTHGTIRAAFKPEQLVLDRTCDVIDSDRTDNSLPLN